MVLRFRVSLFDHVQAGLDVSSLTLLRRTTHSKILCALLCLSTPKCRSFNFCQQASCNINSVDLSHTTDYPEQILSDGKCIYGGVKRKNEPQCWQKGAGTIIEMSNSQLCGLSLKRSDYNLTDQNCKHDCPLNQALSDGNVFCVRENISGLNYAFGKLPLDYGSAVSACRKIWNGKGRLFYDINGTETILKFIYTNLEHCFAALSAENRLVYLNIHDRWTENVYVNALGNDVTSLITPWAIGSPVTFTGRNLIAFECPVSSQNCLYHEISGMDPYCVSCYSDVD